MRISIVLCLILNFSFHTSSAQSESISENVLQLSYPQGMLMDFPKLEEKSAWVWNYVASRASLPKSTLAPEIHISAFDPQKQGKEWTAWQKEWSRGQKQVWADWRCNFEKVCLPASKISDQWIAENIDRVFPFPPQFMAFHYDGTRKIQINPERTFYSFFQNDPYGMKRDFVGLGYYVMAHELFHYALQSKGLPDKIHHCLFIYGENSIMEKTAIDLIAGGLSTQRVLEAGLKGEILMSPCKQLNVEELEQVKAFRSLF